MSPATFKATELSTPGPLPPSLCPQSLILLTCKRHAAGRDDKNGRRSGNRWTEGTLGKLRWDRREKGDFWSPWTLEMRRKGALGKMGLGDGGPKAWNSMSALDRHEVD